MLVPMAQLELIGRRRLLDDHLAMLQHLRAAEVVPTDPVSIDPVSIDPAGPDDPPADDRELATLLGRVDALLALIEDQPDGSADPAPVVLVPADPDAVPALVARCEQAAAGPRATLEHLRGELDSLPRTARSLAALLPLVPELVDLTDADLAQLRLATIVLVLDDPEDAVRAEIGAQLAERFGGRHLFVSAPVDDSLGCTPCACGYRGTGSPRSPTPWRRPTRLSSSLRSRAAGGGAARRCSCATPARRARSSGSSPSWPGPAPAPWTPPA